MSELTHALWLGIRQPIEERVKEVFEPVAPYLRRVSLGAGLIVLSALFFGFVLLMLGLALFFSLSDLPYAIPALWTALAWAGAGVIVGMAGRALCRRPR